MSTTFPPGAVLNTQSFGNRPESVEVPVYIAGAPSTSFVQGSGGIFPIGKRAVDIVGLAVYTLVALSTAGGVKSATWVQDGSSIGTVDVVLGTANQITVTTVGTTATVSLPSAITTPGSLTTTTTLASGTTLAAGTSMSAGTSITAGTTLTATLGNITATNGNLAAPTAGTGIVTTPVIGTTGAGPITANGRVVSATFSSVSIEAAATQALVIANSSITSSSQIGLVSWSGATTASALSLQSVVNDGTANTSTFTFTNGTGATTSTANITITYVLLN